MFTPDDVRCVPQSSECSEPASDVIGGVLIVNPREYRENLVRRNSEFLLGSVRERCSEERFEGELFLNQVA